LDGRDERGRTGVKRTKGTQADAVGLHADVKEGGDASQMVVWSFDDLTF